MVRHTAPRAKGPSTLKAVAATLAVLVLGGAMGRAAEKIPDAEIVKAL